MDLRIFCLFFAPLFGFLVIESRGQPECKAWQNVTDVVKRLDPLNVTCSVNQPCTGFECSGLMQVMTGIQETIRFSVSFIHCANPLQFKVALDIPKYPSFDQTLNIGKNEIINKTYPLPGLTRTYGQVSTEANITVILSSSPSVGDRPLITAEMNVTVRVTESPASYVRNFVLIPNVTFPIPTCLIGTAVSSNATLELTGDSCSAFSLKTKCKGEFQMCNEDGKCICNPGYHWNDAAKQCDTSSPNAKGSTGPAAWIIVVVVLSIVIVTAGFVIFLVRKHRRHQDRYGQHTLLINNDNDTELDDPDAPMLTG